MLTRHGIILVGLNFDIKETSSLLVLIGASAASPTLEVKTENCICLFVWYVCISYMHSALFVRDAHCTLGHVATHSCSRDETSGMAEQSGEPTQ